MAYVIQAEIEAEVPPQHLTDALDDDRDGARDAGLLDQIIANASRQVDGFLATIYTVPFASPPPVVRQAALVFVCEALYSRRERGGDANPWKARADAWREQLKLIGTTSMPLDATIAMAFPPGAVVSDAASVDSTSL